MSFPTYYKTCQRRRLFHIVIILIILMILMILIERVKSAACLAISEIQFEAFMFLWTRNQGLGKVYKNTQKLFVV